MNKLTQTSSKLLTAFIYVRFLCLNNSFKSLTLVAAQAQAVQVKVGVVLDKESMEGKIGLSSINMAISDFYAAHPQFKTRIFLHVRDVKQHDILMPSAAGTYVRMYISIMLCYSY